MDCIDCHNVCPIGSSASAENRGRSRDCLGLLSTSLPYMHREAVKLVQANTRHRPTPRYRRSTRDFGVLQGPARTGRCRGPGTRGDRAQDRVSTECVSSDERDVRHLSQQPWPHLIAGLLPLSRRQPHDEERNHIRQTARRATRCSKAFRSSRRQRPLFCRIASTGLTRIARRAEQAPRRRHRQADERGNPVDRRAPGSTPKSSDWSIDAAPAAVTTP